MSRHDDTPGRDGPALLWFRRDLRLDDHEALAAAAGTGRALIALFVLDDETPGRWAYGGASRWWLDKSLRALDRDLGRRGVKLVLRRGPAAAIVPAVTDEIGAGAVYWTRRYEPWATERDAGVKRALETRRIGVHSFPGFLLHEPWTVRTGANEPFKVYSPFWRACLAKDEPGAPRPAPARLNGFSGAVDSDALEDWGLHPATPDWSAGLGDTWTPGEAGAQARLTRFLNEAVRLYAEDRNRPDFASTSGLSPHLAYGEISPRRVWHAARDAAQGATGLSKGVEKFLSELGWREFSWHLLYHNPDLPERNFRPQFDNFPWADNPPALRAWQRGLTGYPIVDAGMRELWQTGWMHNRVRMIAASFLIKDLLVDWREGEDWFWDTLVDADLGNNAASWQWVAGSGADAAPYFRIFNPVLQGEKFDPDGAYVRRFVPELARLPARFIHRPFEAPEDVLSAAGVRPGETYPRPIVDHGAARTRALAAFDAIKTAA